MGRLRLAVIAVLVLLAGAARPLVADDSAGAARGAWLLSPRYALELPPSPTDDDVRAGTETLRTIERLAAVLDRECVAADVAKSRDLPKADAVKRFETDGPERAAAPPAKGPRRWPVKLRRTREEMETECKAVSCIANTSGTAFYADGTPASFLGVVASEGGSAARKELLAFGAQQFLYERLGLWFKRGANPRGACVVFGFTHFVRWSHVPAGDDFPRELGGIDAKYGDKVRARIAGADPAFPSLPDLFAATPKDFDADTDTLYGASVLFTEFLWETSADVRHRYLKALQAYGASGRPVPAFPLETIVAEMKPKFASADALEKAFRAFATEKSAALNARKAGDAAPAPLPAGK